MSTTIDNLTTAKIELHDLVTRTFVYTDRRRWDNILIDIEPDAEEATISVDAQATPLPARRSWRVALGARLLLRHACPPHRPRLAAHRRHRAPDLVDGNRDLLRRAASP